MVNRILNLCLCLAAVGMTSCGTRPSSSPSPAGESPAATTRSGERPTVRGTIKGISDTHGNAYTSIAPDQYAPLGLATAPRVRVAIGGHDLTLPVVKGYEDAPVGTAMAVLHREGLTLAIRDGNFSQTYGISAGMPFTLTTDRDQAR